jgi:uncharacterized cofD-like protein
MDWRSGFLLGILAAFLFVSLFRSNLFNRGPSKKRRSERKRSQSSVMTNAVDLRLAMGPSIVALGGGTGLSSLLSGLKSFTRNITAVVTVTDEGGSSGRLRDEWGVLPPGDIRNCLVALAEDDNELRQILDFRFDQGELKGHSLGNLILLALTEISGDFRLGVEKINNLLAIRGRVFPVTSESVSIYGKKQNGDIVIGELGITKNGSELQDLWLEPKNAKPDKEVIRSVREAELIVLGPGSLFTSVLPNLMIGGITEEISRMKLPTVYVANLMTQPGETDGFTVTDHVNWIERYLGSVPDFIVVNNGIIPEIILANYSEQGAFPLYLSPSEIRSLENRGCSVVEASLYSVTDGAILRHNGQAVSEILIRICREKE